MPQIAATRRWIELTRPRGQRFEPQRVALDVVAIEPPFAHEHVHHAERERAVGTRQQRDVLVTLFRRQRTVRVDRDQPCAVPLGLLRAAPQVQVGRDNVGAPEDDQLRVLELLDVGAVACTERGSERFAARGGADRPIEEARAEFVEEALRHRLALHHAHRARVAVRHDALRIDGCDRTQARRDRFERLVPAYASEASLALATDALQRMEQPVRVIGALEITADLGAECAGGRRMRRIAGKS